MLKQIIIIISFVFLTTNLSFASYPDSIPYYGDDFFDIINNNFDSKKIKSYLHKVLSLSHLKRNDSYDLIVNSCNNQKNNCYRHTYISYREVRKYLFGKFHLSIYENDYYVTCVYCLRNYFEDDFITGPYPGPYVIPNYKVINTEHTWPQSRFSSKFKKNIQKSDLHALFPANARINTQRGNLEFAEVAIPAYSTCMESKKGHINSISNKNYFEPPNSHKGNVARALFYFSIRYNLSISRIEENYLRKWHFLDPIDDFEKNRNEEIFKVQKNRNPFIDNPWLVSEIDDF